ncbi:Uncharacterised protein [Providencia heimbachae]|nr:Uncharacterised protein [Providencia heimbachae]
MTKSITNVEKVQDCQYIVYGKEYKKECNILSYLAPNKRL